jgi:endonuclease YncB( thermonuclease family)
MKILLAILLVLIFLQVAFAAYDEAIGRVVSVVSGDSFGVEIAVPDARTQHIDRVKLADIESPSTVTPEGKIAKKGAASILKNKTVYLDIDDNSTGGRNDVGQLVCVAYLMDAEGRSVWPCVNRVLVDSGYAVLNDDLQNEFNSTAWWQNPPFPEIRSPKLAKIEETANNSKAGTLPGPPEKTGNIRNVSIFDINPNTSLVSIGYRRE